MNAPWLSIVMPVHNGQEYLAVAMESVAAQATSDIEVLVVDDGSTDRTPEILSGFASRLPLRVIRRERGGNWAAATNQGFAEARGEFLGTLHHDDCWLPGRLETIRRLLGLCPDAALLLHPSWYIDSTGRRLCRWRCPLPPAPKRLESALVLDRLLVQNFISMPAPVFRRETALAVGGLDESLRYTADWDFWMKLAATGPAMYHPEPLSCFRIHAEAQTVQWPIDVFRQQLEVTLARHVAKVPNVSRQTLRAAEFSVEFNTALAAWYHGQSVPFCRLAWLALRLGPLGWRRYLRDSRILERVGSRLRCRKLKAKS